MTDHKKTQTNTQCSDETEKKHLRNSAHSSVDAVCVRIKVQIYAEVIRLRAVERLFTHANISILFDWELNDSHDTKKYTQ